MNRANYLLKEITPDEFRCGVGMCPAVYELAKLDCGVGSCPTLYEDENHQNYLIIGKKAAPKMFGLEGKIGNDEVLISIPKDLVDKMKK